MGKQDFIFDLVRSLSKPEKRYFKLYTSRYKQEGEKKYISLFRAFEKSRSAKAAELSVAAEQANYDGSMAADKHYLSEMLMSSLRQFHSEATVSIRLSNELLSTELLRRKGLFEHALRRIARIKKEAISYELPEIVTQAIRLECETRAAASIEWPQVAEPLYEELDTWLVRQVELNRLDRQRVHQLRLSLEQGRPETEEEIEEWKRRRDYFNPDESTTGLVYETLIRLRAYSHACIVLRDIEETNRINTIQYQLFRQHPRLTERSLIDYLSFLFRHFTTSAQVENYKMAGQLLDEVRSIYRKRKDNIHSEETEFIDDRLLSCELYLFAKTGRFDKVRELSSEAEQFIKTRYTRQQSVIGFNMSVAFLLAEDYRKVIHWTHRALSFPECKKDYMLFLGSNLHQLVAHIELNDFDAAASRVNTLKRFVQLRKTGQSCFDLALIRLLSRCASADDPQLRSGYACEFLEEHGQNAGYLNTDEYVALRSWINKLASLNSLNENDRRKAG